MKQALFQNNGYEELSYEELFSMTNLIPDRFIIKSKEHTLIPRKITNEYIDEISYFSPKYDNLLYCICIEVPYIYQNGKYYKRFYFNPTMRLFATLERFNENEIKQLLGKNDNLNAEEKQKLDSIINLLHNANRKEYLDRKRLSNILIARKIKKLTYKGNAVEALVPSKYSNEYYNVLFKQPIFFENNEIKISPHIQANCTCGYYIHSNVKYEFYNILTSCSHIDFLNQALEEPEIYCENFNIENNKRISNIFSPFKPLDNPILYSERLRTILRNGLYYFLIKQDYIQSYYNDKNSYHQRNGYTWFRCELDAFLLSFSEIYDNDFLKLIDDNHNPELSNLKTSQFLGDYIEDSIIEIEAKHYFSINRNRLEHLVDEKWKKVYHYAYDKTDNKYYLLDYSQFNHDANNNYLHKFNDYTIDPNQISIVHMLKIRKPIIKYETPIQVSELKNGMRIFIYPYKNRKE